MSEPWELPLFFGACEESHQQTRSNQRDEQQWLAVEICNRMGRRSGSNHFFGVIF